MCKNLKELRTLISKEEWNQLAIRSGTTTSYLNQMALGFRRPSPSLASRIEDAARNMHPSFFIPKESLVFADLRKATRKYKRRSSPDTSPKENPSEKA